MVAPGSPTWSTALVGGMSRRTAFRRVGSGGLAFGLSVALGRDLAAVAQEATPTTARDGDLTGEGLYYLVSASLLSRAKLVRVNVDADHIAFSASGPNLVVLAPVVSSGSGFSKPGPIGLAYFSLSSFACDQVASGYYTLKLVQQDDLVPLDQLYPGSSEVAVQFVSLTGEIVAQLPFTRDVMRMPIGEAADDESSPLAEVVIEESRLLTSTRIIITARLKSHHQFAGWEWREWIAGSVT